NRPLDDLLGPGLQHMPSRKGPKTSWVLGVAVVDLLIQLFPAEAHLVGVHHDDEVAGIHVRGELGLMLAPEDGRNPAGEAPQGFSLGVDNIPFALYLARLGLVSLHGQPAPSIAGLGNKKGA